MKRKQQPARVNLSFPDGQKVQPDGFKQIGVGETVKLIVTAKIKSISANAEEWDPGKNISGEIKKIEIDAPAEATSMSQAIADTAAKI